MESLSPELQNVVTQISGKNNIKNYTVQVNNSVSNEGDGYVGILNGLSLIDKDSDKQLNLVVKKAPTNEKLREQFPTRIFFLREICMYDQVIPDLLKFQEKYKITNPFQSVTKLQGYISDDLKETLLLENLKEDGYKMCKRQEPLDSFHLSLVITEYAKFHALSHAMKKLEPERFEKIRKLIGDNMKTEFNAKLKEKRDSAPSASSPDKPDTSSFFGPTLEAVKNKPKELEAVQKFTKNCFQFIFQHQTDEHGVVSHGDCWTANMLFKYENEENPKIPTKLCLIDWQMSLVSTPIQDISFFLYLGAGKNDLENYMRYLQLYHKALSETLAGFGLNAEDVYPFGVFEKQWKEKSKIGFFRTMIMMNQCLSEGKTHDFEELAQEGKLMFDSHKKKVEITELFKQRMGDLVEFLVKHNFI